LYDNLRGKEGWVQSGNDGRAIINDIWRDYENGVPEDELKAQYDVATKKGDYSKLVVYAGTGSGLVTKSQSTREILDELAVEFEERVESVSSRFQEAIDEMRNVGSMAL
jgi:hypothetical protein